MGFLDNLNDAAMEKMAKAAGPKVAEMLGHLRTGIEAQNAHLAAIAGNTSAIGERLASIDTGLAQIYALQREIWQRLHAFETAEQSTALHVTTHARLTAIDTALARLAAHLFPPDPSQLKAAINGSGNERPERLAIG